MFKFIGGIFRENNGNPSAMRLMTWQLVSAGAFIAIYLAVVDRIDAEAIALVLSLVTTGITGKAMQKKTENGTAAIKP